MKAIDLKNSILQLAISGRLVSQDPSDEPASLLYERIQAEKNKLIKEGKIKSQKKNGRIDDDFQHFIFAQSKTYGLCFTSTSCTSGSLQIICRMRW